MRLYLVCRVCSHIPTYLCQYMAPSTWQKGHRQHCRDFEIGSPNVSLPNGHDYEAAVLQWVCCYRSIFVITKLSCLCWLSQFRQKNSLEKQMVALFIYHVCSNDGIITVFHLESDGILFVLGLNPYHVTHRCNYNNLFSLLWLQNTDCWFLMICTFFLRFQLKVLKVCFLQCLHIFSALNTCNQSKPLTRIH